MSFYTALTGLNGAQSDISATSKILQTLEQPALREVEQNSVTFLLRLLFKTHHPRSVLVPFLKVSNSSLHKVTSLHH